MAAMLSALAGALRDVFDPALRRTFILAILVSLAVLVALWVGLATLLAYTAVLSWGWLELALDILGGLAAAVLAFLLFPAAVTLVLGIVLEGVVGRLEALRYPRLPPAREGSAWTAVLQAARLALLALVLNLAVLIVYLLVPGLNVLLFYAVNGYLLGREYFELVALRRHDQVATKALWRARRLRFLAGGIVIAVLLTIPVVNLGAPLIAAAFMVRLYHGRPAEIAANAAIS